MNDLRLILLGIGLLIISAIYIWGTFKQKAQDRARTRKLTSFKRDPAEDVKIMPEYDEDDEESVETLAEMNAFLSNSELHDINTSNFSLLTKTAKFDEGDLKLSKSVPEKSDKVSDHKKQSHDVVKDESRQENNDHQIITFLIKASPGKEFSGNSILEATESVGLRFGDMNIFHHHGIEGMENEEAIFSLASMYEPGYFNLNNMEIYQTKGLTLFMQLPAPVDNMSAFILMQETAMELAEILQGEVCSSKHQPMDEKALRAMRDMVVESS